MIAAKSGLPFNIVTRRIPPRAANVNPFDEICKKKLRIYLTNEKEAMNPTHFRRFSGCSGKEAVAFRLCTMKALFFAFPLHGGRWHANA